jgi:hypothetical protein
VLYDFQGHEKIKCANIVISIDKVYDKKLSHTQKKNEFHQPCCISFGLKYCEKKLAESANEVLQKDS